MKKFYSFLLVATALLISGNAQAVNVSSPAELKAALSSGGDITLTANITTSETLQVSQITNIDGNGFCIKGTANPVFEVVTTGKIQFNNLVIYESSTLTDKNKTTEAAILIQTSNTNVTLDNVTINTVMRGINVWDANNVNLTINNSTIQLVPNGGGTQDATTGMPATDNYDEVTTAVNGDYYSRGLNVGRVTNSNITLNNSTIQGFFYNVNVIGGTMEGTKVICNNSTFKGRAALNIWSWDGYFEVNDCNVLGINNFKGQQESFACFVINTNTPKCENNTLVINGGTTVGVAFDETGARNEYALQYMVTDRQGNNTIQINNAQFTCDKTLTENKGGIFEQVHAGSTIEINGGIFDCPNIIQATYSSGGNTANVSINGGTYNVIVVSPDMTDGDVYKTIEINAGNFTVADTENGINSELEGVKLLGEGMTVVTNLDGSVTAMTTEEAANVGTYTADADITADETKSLVEVAAAKTITVKAGTTLTIGEGGLLFEDNTSKLVVEDGGRVILNGNVNGGGDASSLVIETSEGSSTALVINPNVNVYGDEHPQGTFKFTSKGSHSDKWVWQRFGVPAFDGNTTMTWEGNIRTVVEEYSYDIDDWNKIYDGNDGTYTFVNTIPFNCYTMTTDAPAAGTVYTFTGSLMGNQNAELQFIKGWNYYANSYTAPIDIKAMLEDIKAKYGTQIDATAYIYKSEGNRWDLINLGTFDIAAITGESVAQTTIDPMQAFILRLYNGNAAVGELDYTNDVYNPAVGIASAPRRVASSDITSAVRMTVANTEYTDELVLMESDNFSEAYDNGFDAPKYMNNAAHNLYAVGMNDDLAAVATNNLEGTTLSFSTANAGVYTLTFNKVANAAYAIRDNRTNTIINIEEGATYMFAAEEGVNEARFSIIGRADAPTAVETVKVAENQAGVYSIAGQYMGEKSILNTLPAGVYVVDGKKIVK